MATINEIKQQAASVKNATQVGENTAERVGGALAGLADIAEQQDTELGKKFDKESVVQESGDAEDKVMSQKATTNAIADETTRAKTAEDATAISLNLILEEDEKYIVVGSIYNGNKVSSYDCLANDNFIEVLASRNYRLKHASDITLRITEYNADKQYIRDSGSYKAIENIALSETTKYIKISASYIARGFNQSNPISVSDYQNDDFAVMLPVAKNIVTLSKTEELDNGIKALTTGATKRFTVSAGHHSSNNDAIKCFIEAGRKVCISLKNITTSNKGYAYIYVLYEGDKNTTPLKSSVGFDNFLYETFERNVVSIGLYWDSNTGTTSGIVEIEVFYSSSIKNRLNAIAYIANGAIFEWRDVNPTTIKFGNALIIKNVSDDVEISINDILDIASEATGFTVNRDENSVNFPAVGTMYYDTENRTVGFINNSTITNDSRYIALFASHYASTRYGLLVDYVQRKNYNSLLAGLSLTNSLASRVDDIELSIRPISVELISSADAQKYYPVSLKRNGRYSIKNTGGSINSLYLCSSVSDHDENRVQTIGSINQNETVNFTVESDGVVCIDGWWPADTEFQIIYQDSIENAVTELQGIAKTKQNFAIKGQDETYISRQFVVGSNRVYRLIPSKTIWSVATNTKSYSVVAFEIVVNDVVKYKRFILAGASTFEEINSFIDIEIPDLNNSGIIKVGFRAIEGEEVSFELIDITSLEIVLSTNSLFKNNPDEEFAPKVRTLKKNTPYGFGNRPNSPLVLLWFSDLHADLTNIERINLWKTKYNTYIDDVLNTGDTIDTTLSTYKRDIDPYFNTYGGGDILLALGNHDVTSPNSSLMAWDGTQSITDMYNKYIGRLNANTLGIIQPANAAENGYCYYYKDYVGLGISTSGIRLIVIDSCITDADYQTVQVTWFVETLAAAKTLGYDVIVASHYMPGGCDEFDDAKGFCYFVKQYRVGESIQVDSRYTTAIDDFIGEGGKFVTWLCGHVHSDHVGTVPSHSNQMVISVTSACLTTYSPSDIMPVRITDTKSQDAFDLIEIDTYYKQVKLVRVGYNVDSLGREINMIALDYQNKKVII